MRQTNLRPLTLLSLVCQSTFCKLKKNFWKLHQDSRSKREKENGEEKQRKENYIKKY